MPVSLLIVLLLAGVWLLVTGDPTPGQMVIGLVAGLAFVAATGAGRGARVSLARLPRRIGYLAFFLLILLPWAVLRANLDLARRMLRWRPELEPAILRLPLGEDTPGVALGLEEHAITLAPGQALVDYSADENIAYFHVAAGHDAVAHPESVLRPYRRILREVFG